MEDRLAQLKRQKHEIDLEIKRIIEDSNTKGKAKLFYHNHSRKYAEWRVAVMQSGGLESWKTIISSKDRETALDMIPQYIENLADLYNHLKVTHE